MELTRQHWTSRDYAAFMEYLHTLGDENYKVFNQKIIPDTENAVGIRIPALRAIAKQIAKGNAAEFIACPKGNVHEELIIEGLVLTNVKCSYEELLSSMKYFSEKIYNWAICDTVSFKQLKKHLEPFIEDVRSFIESPNPWVQRFGFGCLLQFYLSEPYINQVLSYVRQIDSSFYYVQMMQAWLLATAFTKCREQTLAFLESTPPPVNAVTMNMTVQKIRDSLRVSKEDKQLVLKFKTK